MGMHASKRVSRHLGQRILTTLTLVAAVCGGLLTSNAVASEPAKCNTGVDKVCYAGYSAAGLKQIADDLSDKGKTSTYYAEMEKNLTDGVKGTLTLSDGSNLPFQLIGILHDDKADGSGKKAGLTFMAWSALPKAYSMNDSSTNRGGWRDSLLRNLMNNGEIWSQFPTDFQNNVTTVLKQTNNMDYGDTSSSAASATADKVWLVSNRELVSSFASWMTSKDGYQAIRQEGSQYEYFTKKNVSAVNYKELAGIGSSHCWWERSPMYYNCFLPVKPNGDPSDYYSYRGGSADNYYSVVPAFSF